MTAAQTKGPGIHVVGIGEDGLAGLSPAARALVDGAEVLVGGARHHEKVPDSQAERLDWSTGFDAAMDAIEARFGRRIVVLGSGDPSYFGVATTLIRRFGAEDVFVLPAPGAISLACARLGWSVPDVQAVTVHGRALENLNVHLAPGARLVVLARDGDSPAEIAALLTAQGFGLSRMTVLEHMGGERESRIDGVAQSWSAPRSANLCTVAIECIAGPDARPLSRLAGLPDEAFAHDGQLTKREVRAVTLARLAPLPGETLWDVGAGAGSIGIEWMRTHQSCQAVAIERDANRAQRIARNAANLGVPRLHIEVREALDALRNLDGDPDAVFVGGGVGAPGVLEAAWKRVKPGGRLVANAVTAEGAAALAGMKQKHGGELIQISVSRQKDKASSVTLFDPMRTVTQYLAYKYLNTKD